MRQKFNLKFYLTYTLLSLFVLRLNCFALPEVETVVEGSAEITNPDNLTLQIYATNNTILNYKSFDIGENESVIISLPTVDSQILNRVLGDKASKILGKLTCNGILILINQNGIYFGPNSNVDAAGLIASTRDITNSNFLSSKYIFEKLSPEQLDMLLVNQGKLNIKEGGFGVLIAGAIENSGIISAPVGTIAFAAGDMVSLDISTDGLISIAIDKPTASKVYDLDGNPITEQIKNTGTIEAVGGSVWIKAESLPGLFEKAINLEGYVKAERLSVAGDSLSITSQATLTEVYKLGSISLTNSYIQDNLITLEGEGFKVTYLKDSNLTLQTDNAINTTPGLIIQANNLKLIAKQFGSLEVPLELLANLTYIYRLSGNIDILESLGLGTSIMLRGPPATGFGAIIYNQDTSLTLEAPTGSLTLSSAVSLIAKNLTLISLQGIYSYANLVADETITLKSSGAIISHGSLKTPLLFEEGASFSIGGTYSVGYALLKNQDNAVTLETGNYTGETSDIGNIIVKANAIITLTGNTIFRADSDLNGTGAFTMNNGSSIMGGGFNLDIYASQDSTLRSISGVATFTLAESQSNSNPTYTANDDITLTNFTLAGSITLTVSGNWSISGTFTANTSTVIFDKPNGTQTLNSGGSSFYNIEHSGRGTLQLTTNNLTVTHNFTNSSGTFDLNGQNWIMTGATFSNEGIVQLSGLETITGLTNDTTAGTWVYVGRNIAETITIKDFGTNDYFNLTINDTNSNKATYALGQALDVNGNFNLSGGTFSQGNNTINIAGDFTLASGTTFTKATGGEAITFDGTGATKKITDNNTTKQDLGAVIINGDSDTKVALETAIKMSSLSINSAKFFSFNGNNFEFSSPAAISNLATINLKGNEILTNVINLDLDSGSVNYEGTGITETLTLKDFGAIDYYNLLIDGGNTTFQLGADLSIAGTFTLKTNSTFDANGRDIHITGDFSNSGTFMANSSTLIFEGSSASQILGSSTFYNLSSTTPGKELIFEAGSTQTITGTLTLSGDSGNLITLRSLTTGAQWKIDAQGTRSVSFVDVKDSDNINSIMINPSNSIDSGNNINWFPRILTQIEIERSTRAIYATLLRLTLLEFRTAGEMVIEYPVENSVINKG